MVALICMRGENAEGHQGMEIHSERMQTTLRGKEKKIIHRQVKLEDLPGRKQEA